MSWQTRVDLNLAMEMMSIAHDGAHFSRALHHVCEDLLANKFRNVKKSCDNAPRTTTISLEGGLLRELLGRWNSR